VLSHRMPVMLFLQVLLLWFCVSAQAATDKPLDKVHDGATAYAASLAAQGGADYSEAERETLLRAAELLLQRHQCKQATDLLRQMLSGLAQPAYADWRLLARASNCAQKWNDAVYSAYLGFLGADNHADRQALLGLLGRALEGHWNYGTAEALAAYRAALRYGADDGLAQAAQRLEKAWEEEQGLRVDRSFVLADGAVPALCLDFSDAMAAAEERHYADYIRFNPPFAAVFRKHAYDEICADGAEFGTTYQVRVLPGLSSDNDNRVGKAIVLQAEVGDRSPRVWFSNSHYVLPKGGGIPVHSVNVDKARLTLYRIGERNLLNEAIKRSFRSDIGRYKAHEIRDELGEELWSGEADLTSHRNREAVSNLPLASLIEPAAGVYLLTAKAVTADEENDYGDLASQWLVVSDIGLTTYRGKDGLTVASRSLATAQPLAGIKLVLYGRNNQALAQTVTDAGGVARFAEQFLDGKGGREAIKLMAFGAAGDFNFLDITGSPFDLSDRGVKGRAFPGPIDAFLYTERGVYRPGEQVNLGVLLRNSKGLAVDGLPLTIRLLRPDEQIVTEQLIQPQGAGGYSSVLAISTGARSGRWKALAYLDRDAEPLGQVAFLVEDIVPPRLELEVKETPPSPLGADGAGRFGIQARYLFGAPGADLAATAEVRISADPDPFPQFPGYRFGPVDEAEDSVLLTLLDTRTDAQGQAAFAFRLERLPNITRPLRAQLRAEVSDVDGRAVAITHWLPVRQQPLMIGVKAVEETLKGGEEALFEVLALDPQGVPQAHPGLAYRLISEDVDYQWYQDDGRWRYKRQVRDRTVSEGSLAVTAAAPGRLGMPLEHGRYRLEVRDSKLGLLSSVRVTAGWQGGGADAETPDMLTLRSERSSYAPGDMARLRLEAPFAGSASLVIATDRVLSVQAMELDGSSAEWEIAVDPQWGAGAYALVTAYRPDGARAGHGPRRAVGVVWLGVDKATHQLDVSLRNPEQVRPLTTLELDLAVTGQAPGETVYVTLAAVDEGVLQLTDYQRPDPLQHYFGQRQLAIGMRDLYGRLIDGHLGAPSRIRSGGGASGRQGMADSHVKIVSLFSGVVRPDASGQARITFAVPQFEGRLRLSAVAWSGQRLGSGESQVTVRDPVVMMLSVPRFLAADDTTRASVLLQNLEGPEGLYQLSWKSTGALRSDALPAQREVSLSRGQREVVQIPLQGAAVGNGYLSLRLLDPQGAVTERQVGVGVRAPFLPQTQREFGQLMAGFATLIKADAVAALRPETLSTSLSISPQPDLDVPGLLRQLDLYPYGCLEQVTSRAFPLLHIDELSRRWNYRSDAPVRQRLADAVARIIDKQLLNGGFALWQPSGEEEPWLSAYAMDFLQRARAAGVSVPDFVWERGLGWLRRQVTYPQTDDANALAAQAYALYLLTRHGERNEETARYLLDEGAGNLHSSLAAAQLGAVFTQLGDADRAAIAFALARKLQRSADVDDYGSRLRDLAALTLMQAELDPAGAPLADLVQTLSQEMRQQTWLSTQEQAWLVRAAASLPAGDTILRLSVQGIELPPRRGALVLKPTPASLLEGVELRNQSAAPAWYSLTVDGSPLAEPPPLQDGMRIRRSLHRLNGEPINPDEVVQGELLVALLQGAAKTEGLKHQALIVDPLPAGFEVENARLAHARNAHELAWIGRLSDTEYSEALDDRFVAAVNLLPEQRVFRLAYLVRAVSPGRYRMPPPAVEDMYKPWYRGRGKARWLRVAPAG
jgi:uncharacterized protein YfaS (alpha-2-macroglobulin family)